MTRRRAPILVLVLLGCAGCGRTPRPLAFSEPQPHFGDAWWTYRAQGLGISVEAAQARDAALSTTAPPNDSWDTQTAEEAKAVWAGTCAKCHGLTGHLEGAPKMDPPPKEWGGMGPAMGFFFGGDKMRAGVYERIAEGGKRQPSKMPGWKDTLSREQMWALVFFLEQL